MILPDKIILIDGDCTLCLKSVQFIIRNNPKKDLYFGSLQSEIAKEIALHYPIDVTEFHSIVFIKNQQLFQKSTAVIQICKHLKMPYPLLIIALLIPKKIRDALYAQLAKRRKSFFKNEVCTLHQIAQDRIL